MHNNLHQSNWHNEAEDGEGEHVEIVVTEVAVPVVDGAHRAAGLHPEPAHHAHGRRGSAQEGEHPKYAAVLNFASLITEKVGRFAAKLSY